MVVSVKKQDVWVAPRLKSSAMPSEDDGLDMQGLGEKSMTHQEFRDECDINKIFEKYLATGGAPFANPVEPVYGDFSDARSYQESLAIVAESQERFFALSARVRQRFENDPVKFLEFVNDKKNSKEVISLGLASVREGFNSDGTRVTPSGAVPVPPEPKAKG